MNKVFIIGNLCENVDCRSCGNGDLKIAKFNMAINEKINNNNIVTYITVKCMGKVAENCAKYLTTGSQVLVEGKLRLDQWKDKKTNQNRQMLYLHADIVTFLEKPQANNQILTNNDNPPHGYDDDPVF